MKAAHTAVVAMPALDRAQKLIKDPWTSIEVQGGRLRHRSARFPGAWSTAALLVHTPSEVLIYCDSVDSRDGERFTLRIVDAMQDVAASQLKAARPSYAALRNWPVDLRPLAEFLSKGPHAAETGFGPISPSFDGPCDEKLMPALWCSFYSDSGTVMIYADVEIPLNVGIVTNLQSISAIKSELKAVAKRRI